MSENINTILHSKSRDNGNGLEIDYSNIHVLNQELKDYMRMNIEKCCLHMLQYCFDNVGKQDVDTGKELDNWLKENIE